MSDERFSTRFGHGPAAADITVRESAPQELRDAILIIARDEMGFGPSTIRGVLCKVLRKLPNPDNWTAYPNVWNECLELTGGMQWYRFYDFLEALSGAVLDTQGLDEAHRWEGLVNEYFLEAGVGWKLVHGALESRGPEAFEVTVTSAATALLEARMPTAQQEIHEALRDLSRRPTPDVTGAIQHAMAALECTAREYVGDPQATLGAIIARHRGVLFPRPLDEGIEKLWGYASETGRHLREGRAPGRAEAELVVGVASAACLYLATKRPE